MTLPYVQPLADGVHVIDTGFHRPLFDASYLIVEAGRAAFIDTGTNLAVPRLLAALADLGLTPDAVDFVIPTHVHLALKSALASLYRDQLHRHGVQDVESGLALLALDIELNAQGLGIWLDRASR